MNPPSDYRSDIDGLRAIAVLSVLAFHYEASFLPGGFAGVDVFFVISGYLITKHLTETIDRQGHNLMSVLVDFYGKRVRRIFPALIAMLIATLAIGWFLLVPDDYAKTGASSAFAAVGASNIYFFWNTAYFDRAAELQLLLHTWSLGVEEQFYVAWPVLLFLLLKIVPRRWIATIVALLVVAGLGYSNITVAMAPKAAFYLPHLRAWELGAGALLAFLPVIASRVISESATLLGLTLVAFSMLTLKGSETALGLSMAPAVLGSALVICRKAPSVTANALGSMPLRAIGKISYSLYLWHWPVLVFYKLTHSEQLPQGFDLLWLIVITFGLSALSYSYIEQPFRKPRTQARLAVPAVLAVVLAGTVVAKQDGFPSRLTLEAVAMYASAKDFNPRRARCQRFDTVPIAIEKSCLFGLQSVSPTTAVWSDSHGVELPSALGEIEAPQARSVIQLTYSSCPPALYYESPDHQLGCRPFNSDAISYLVTHPGIRTVIMTAQFEYYLSKPDSIVFIKGFETSVAKLAQAGKRVILIASNPLTGYSIPQAAARLAMSTTEPEILLPLTEHRQFTEVSLSMLEGLARRYPNVELIDPIEVFCTDQGCPMIVDGKPILFDDNHLTQTSARLLAAKIDLAAPFVARTR